MGALIGIGIPEIEAKRYGGRLAAGNILISTNAESSEDVTEVKRVYEQAGAQDIVTGKLTTPPTVQTRDTRQPRVS